MSQENVEIVKASNEAWNRGDMDALRELYDPNAMLVTALDDLPEGGAGPVIGREAVMRMFEQMRETWDADAVETITDFIHAGDRVVGRIIWRGVGHGPEAAFELTIVYTVRKARIFLLEWFWDHAEALEAVGLSE
jgi:ketosteroid isomerase-like protein